MQLVLVLQDHEKVEADLLVQAGDGSYTVSREDVVLLAPGAYVVERLALVREVGEGSDGSLIIEAILTVDLIGKVAVELERFPDIQVKKGPVVEPVADA